MEEKKEKRSLGVVPFSLGFIGALIMGWWVFPQVLWSERQQPINFDHPLHVEEVGMFCEDCHFYREDGTFSGLPTLESCTDCHMDVMDPDNPNDVRFIEEYVFPEREIPWLVYQKQPDNVYFSHIAHQAFECNECHPDVATMKQLPPLRQNRLSTYSWDTMRMGDCERCHALNDVTNACFVCHK
jgi:menaquinone reductase, multiheme cytochrome c subunit